MKTKLFTVRTTRKDIAEWQAEIPHRCKCPIRMALIRLGFKNVLVIPSKIQINKTTIKTASRVSKWIEDLDCGKPVRPITFKIKLPV